MHRRIERSGGPRCGGFLRVPMPLCGEVVADRFERGLRIREGASFENGRDPPLFVDHVSYEVGDGPLCIGSGSGPVGDVREAGVEFASCGALQFEPVDRHEPSVGAA